MTRDTIKYIAMFTMLLNHIANIFLEPGTLLFEVLVDVGYFTAITMCYFLVEGYGYTRSKEKYGKRLLLFAALSQLPFNLAFTENGVLEFTGMNMIFTLFLCFLILYVREKMPAGGSRNLCICVLVLASFRSDWALLAPLFTIGFAETKVVGMPAGQVAVTQKQGTDQKRSESAGRNDVSNLDVARRKILWNAFGKAMLIFWLLNFMEDYGNMALGSCLLRSAGATMGILLSAICIIYFYNGKRAQKGQKFAKWFFYIFYPAHLLVLGVLRIILG